MRVILSLVSTPSPGSRGKAVLVSTRKEKRLKEKEILKMRRKANKEIRIGHIDDTASQVNVNRA